MDIQTPMTQGRYTRFISTSKWIRTVRLSFKHSLSLSCIFERYVTELALHTALKSIA